MLYKELYHLDNNENVRTWQIEREGASYRTISGTQGGKKVTSKWRTVEGKNLDKSNETTDEEQAEKEVEALYQKKLDRKYNLTLETATKSNFVQPMLADKFDKNKTLKKPKTWYRQPKFDGIRSLIDVTGSFSRQGKFFFTVEHIVEELEKVSAKYNVTFDGELYNHEYKDDFNKISSLVKKQKLASLTEEEKQEIVDKVQFHVYDIIFWDCLEKPYKDRLDFLNKIFIEDFSTSKYIKQCETDEMINPTIQEISNAHDNYFINGYEGLMLRDANSPYEFKRSKGLLKYKNFDEDEFTLLEIIEGQGNWEGAAKAVIVKLKDGSTSEAGVSGTYEYNAYILNHAKEYIGGQVTVKYQGFTKDGKLRFGVVKAFHKGKRDY